MKIYIFVAQDRHIEENVPFIVGAFSSHEKTMDAMRAFEQRHGEKYQTTYAEWELDKTIEVHEPEISLEERIEALEQYMNVAQMKIMTLQSYMHMVLFDLKDQVGDDETRKRMDAVMREFGRHRR
jgi:hypothetical protein